MQVLVVATAPQISWVSCFSETGSRTLCVCCTYVAVHYHLLMLFGTQTNLTATSIQTARVVSAQPWKPKDLTICLVAL